MRFRKRTAIASISLIALGAACMKDAAAPALTLEDCAVDGLDANAKCGTLEVPEDWSKPEGRKIALNILVAPAIEPAGEAPLFDLAGGPGVASTNGAPFYFTDGAAARATRDVVMVDQRGTGASAALRCPALEQSSPLARMYPPQDVADCRDALSRDHDLAQYTTLAAARDIDAVRAALGAETIDLFGLSYGTKLAQAYIREYPARVRSAVFMGAAPMDLKPPLFHARNAENTLNLIFADCAADRTCAAAYPDLAANWRAVSARFDAGPITMATPDGAMAVARGPFMETFRAQLSTEAGQRRAPQFIEAAARGDFTPVVAAATSGPRGFIAEGLYLAVECAEGTALIDPEEIEAATAETFLGRYRVDEQIAACADWPMASVATEFAEPVNSDVPALFLAGGRDHVTPPADAERVASGFSNARVILIEDMGHVPEAISEIGCLDAMINDFYENPDPAALDANCVKDMKAPPFALPVAD